MGRDRVVTPTEFWRLSPIEVHWLLNGRKVKRQFGALSEDEVKELYEEEYGPVDG